MESKNKEEEEGMTTNNKCEALENESEKEKEQKDEMGNANINKNIDKVKEDTKGEG